ncbi:hypothetical protein Zm00014a_036439 [Zea mays]|uniref:Uncharacterized protein n=1 Tax=Zea mays TaxID=4577 RepID=A0A3L6EGG4_MAIZE|nr:hypothetical protein Zm00014a_036439 [Zea mays]
MDPGRSFSAEEEGAGAPACCSPWRGRRPWRGKEPCSLLLAWGIQGGRWRGGRWRTGKGAMAVGGAMGAWSSAPCALLPWDACCAMEKKKGRLLWRLEKNEGWECKIAQVQGERAAIYRETLGLGLLSGPNGLGWAGPNTLSGCAKHFPE